MTRVSTQGSYQSALLNLFAAQARQADAQARLGTEKVATDLSGFGRAAEGLTALKASQARLQGFIDTGEAVLARLDSQDLALTTAGDTVSDFRDVIAQALASETGTTLLLEANTVFQNLRGLINTQHQGQYVFGGGNNAAPPFVPQTLAAAAGAPVADAFANGNLPPVSRVSESTSLETGMLAADLGSETLQILTEIHTYAQTLPGGTFPTRLTAADKAFLEPLVARLTTAAAGVISAAARNGNLHTQVESVTANNRGQVQQLTQMVGKRTDADLAQAAIDIRLSEVAIQASAQVINGLRDVSLLNFLR